MNTVDVYKVGSSENSEITLNVGGILGADAYPRDIEDVGPESSPILHDPRNSGC